MSISLLKLLTNGAVAFVDPTAPQGTVLNPNDRFYRAIKLTLDDDNLKINIAVPAAAVLGTDETGRQTIVDNIVDDLCNNVLTQPPLNMQLNTDFEYIAGSPSIILKASGRKKILEQIPQSDATEDEKQKAAENLRFISMCLDAKDAKAKTFLKERIFSVQNVHPLIGVKQEADGSCYLYLKNNLTVSTANLRLQALSKVLISAVNNGQANFGQVQTDFDQQISPARKAIFLSKEEYTQLKQAINVTPALQQNTQVAAVPREAVKLFSEASLHAFKQVATNEQMQWQPVDPTKTDKENDKIKIVLPSPQGGGPAKSLELDKSINGVVTSAEGIEVYEVIAKLYASMKPEVTTLEIKMDPMDTEKVKQLAETVIKDPYNLTFKVVALPNQQPVVTTDQIVALLDPAVRQKYEEINNQLTAATTTSPLPAMRR